jgi:hypothetical protein
LFGHDVIANFPQDELIDNDHYVYEDGWRNLSTIRKIELETSLIEKD